MLVSIIISSHNYEQYLRQAIDSALNQSHPDVEVVVVDDASTDGSRQILDEYENIETRLLDRNGGQMRAVNEGFRIARGEVVIFLDADDVLMPDAAALHVARLSANPAASKCQGYMQVVDKEGKPGSVTIPRKLFPPGNYRSLTLERGIGALPHTFTSGNAWPRWFLEKVMPFPEALGEASPDGCLNAVSALHGPIEVVEDTVCLYRIHGGNRSRRQFDIMSLEGSLLRAAEMREYLAASAEELGFTVDLEKWRRRKRSWRDHVMARSVYLLRGEGPEQRYLDFVLAPFSSGRTGLTTALPLAGVLAVIWILPKTLALRCCARLLGYRQKGETLIAPSRSETVLAVSSSMAKKFNKNASNGGER